MKGNPAYRRGRALEWQVQKLFKAHGYSAMRTAGSHGFADVIITRKAGDATDLARPITKTEIDEVLAGWLPVHDPKQILDPFLYGKVKHQPRGGKQVLHLAPAQCWVFQMKTEQPKKTGKKKGGKR